MFNLEKGSKLIGIFGYADDKSVKSLGFIYTVKNVENVEN